jgi:gas vesicle protein
MTKSRLIISIASGFLAGVAVGILFAPYKGSKTRRKILRAGGDLSEGIKTGFYNLSNFVGEKLDSKGVYRHFIRFGRSATHI